MNLDDINLISEGIAIIILSVIGFSLKTVLNASKELESIPANLATSFVLYLAGLIVIEKNANCSKMAEKLGSISHDKLTRTLGEGEVLVGKIGIIFINLCLSQTGGGFLILDDFLAPKRYSKVIEGVYNEYDHIDKERIRGMRIVMLIWSNGNIRIPIAWAIWHKEDKALIGFTRKGQPKYKHTGLCLLKINGALLPYRTKNEIGLELLTEVLAKGLNPKYFTFDSWYASKRNLKAFHLLALPFYSRLKSNRKVIFQGEEISIKKLADRIATSSFDHKHGAYIKAENVYLPGFREIKLLFVRKDKHSEPGSTKYLFSNDLGISACQLLLRYRSRWLIETMFRDIKQNLNLGACQARSLTQQKVHIALVLLAFVILESQPTLSFDSIFAKTVGEKKKLLSSLLLLKKHEKHWIIDMRKTNSKPVLLENSSLGGVKLTVDFAFSVLNYQRKLRSA